MMHWEYKIIKGEGWNRAEHNDLLAELNAQGNSGWELVAVVGEWFYFKRELSREPSAEENT